MQNGSMVVDRMWRVRDVPSVTRKKVKDYAYKNSLTIAKALEQLVDKALSK